MSERHEDAVAYALTSLDAAELAEFEAHLDTCELCQQEVAEFCETAAELSFLNQAAPPPTLRAMSSRPSGPCPLPAEDEATGSRTSTDGAAYGHPESWLSHEQSSRAWTSSSCAGNDDATRF